MSPHPEDTPSRDKQKADVMLDASQIASSPTTLPTDAHGAAEAEREDWDTVRDALEGRYGEGCLATTEGRADCCTKMLEKVLSPSRKTFDVLALSSLTRHILDKGEHDAVTRYAQGVAYHLTERYSCAADAFAESDKMHPDTCLRDWLDSLEQAGRHEEAATVRERLAAFTKSVQG